MKTLRGNCLLCLVLFSGAVFGSTLSQQRTDFLAAEKQIARGNYAEFARLSESLTDYPLYPFLQYEWLKENLEQTELVRGFLTNYSDTRHADLLRLKWLDFLAKNERWADFIRDYRSSSNKATECQYYSALYHTGNKTDSMNGAKRLWLTGDSLPTACDTLLSQLILSPALTPDLIWQRFRLALNKDNTSLAEYLRGLMNESARSRAGLWLDVHRKPALVESIGLATEDDARLFAHAILRMVKSDLLHAVRLWDGAKMRLHLDDRTIRETDRKLALNMAYSRIPGAYYRLSQLPADEAVNEWKVRAALFEQNWWHVAEALAGFSPKQRSDPQWQYWEARSLAETGNDEASRELFKRLAEDRSFYGFMAADYAGKPYRFSNRPVPVTGHELDNLAAENDFAVVKELIFHHRETEAERQWWYALRKLSKDRLPLAGKLAQLWHWDKVAIITMVKADYWDDLALRFPVYYADQIRSNASRHDLDPSIVFGLIRQESIFNKDARSGAGARGLMQLMPQTGKQIARELKEKWRSDGNLYNPDVNVRYGAYYYKKLLRRFGGHAPLAIAAYNAGPGKVAKWLPEHDAMPADIWIETIPYKETRKYVTSVLAYAIIYQQLTDGKGLKIKELLSDVLSG